MFLFRANVFFYWISRHMQACMEQAWRITNAQPTAGDTMNTLYGLTNLDRPELGAAWQEQFSSLPPKGISQDLMCHVLAFEYQLKTYGGLDTKSKRALRLKRHNGSKPSPRKMNPKLQVGARLIRVWNGTTQNVDVTPTGFEWRGKPYRSLTAIAKAITGTHWSGPRFFGLDKKALNNG
jgi:hypothetical protein